MHVCLLRSDWSDSCKVPFLDFRSLVVSGVSVVSLWHDIVCSLGLRNSQLVVACILTCIWIEIMLSVWRCYLYWLHEAHIILLLLLHQIF